MRFQNCENQRKTAGYTKGKKECEKAEHWIITVWKHAHLDVGHFVVGAGGQKELLCRVGELTVVNLLLVLLRESSQQLVLFCVPHLKLTGTLILA